MPASNGTSFTNVAKDVVAKSLTSSLESLILPNTGTIKKITYGKILSPMT